MKPILNKIAIIAGLSLLASCQSFFDEDPVYSTTTDTFFNSETALETSPPIPHAVKEPMQTTAESKTAAIRPVITLKSTAGTGFTYTTTKNRRNTPDRLELTKFDPVVRKRVLFRETR